MLNPLKTLNFSSLLLRRTLTLSFSPLIPTTSHHYDELINAAGRSGDFSAVRRLLNNRWRDGFLNTKFTFNFITSELTALEETLQTLKYLDIGFAKKGAYDSLIARLSKLEHTRHALRVAQIMVSDNVGANAMSFHPILNYMSRKNNGEAVGVLKMMRGMKVFPDVTSYNYVLTAYCCDGRLEEAVKVVDEMDENGIVYDSRTYDALLLGACKAKRVDGGLVLLRRMVDEGMSTLYSTHIHVINALLKMGYYGQAVEFVLIYAGTDKALDHECFGVLARRLITLKKFDEAKLVLEEMRSRGLEIEGKLAEAIEMRDGNMGTD
ncbi:pentatricopeptide repeat-containing protein At3g56030, mitochondrial-like [Apium graveolens]|uniref:pentatricopeptide repeat-containing protein At3g56030, mitochondrial-like n=1 Tax=Apium graveolens TaxID=4045 RepID=UPI003D7A742A